MTSVPQDGRANIVSSRLAFWLGLVITALVFIAGAALTWRRWPDLIIDFSQQLYIPWRLNVGDTLYKDLFYLAGGPLSQYYHAALFHWFGVSFLTLIISNLAITAAMLAVIYQQFAKATNAFTATAIAVAVTVVFAFAQYTGIGNNNYVTPYSHELLHGLALSVFMVALLASWLCADRVWSAVLAGFCFGLVLLTKPDIFTALGLTTLVALVLAFKLKMPRRFIAKSAVGFALAAVLPPLLFFIFFLQTESWRESLRLDFFGWRPLFLGGVVQNPFYQWSLGLDTPFEHLRQISRQFLTAAISIVICGLAFRAVNKSSWPKRWLVNFFVLAALWFAATKFNWFDCGASLPLICGVTILLLASEINRGNGGQPLIFPLLWSVFALFLLAKQGVFPRIWHTGFALAMPAFVGAVYLLLWRLPHFLENRHKIPRRPMQLAALGVLTIAGFSLARISAQHYSTKNLAVGHGTDVIYARSPAAHSVEGRDLNLALDWIEKNVSPTATLAALPQGLMLNYLSRRANSTPCLDWNPTILAFFGATNMTVALTNHPPDYLALVEWQTYEFGTGYFGTAGYGEDVMAWIHKNYLPVALFGSEPLHNGLFGIKILKRQLEASATNRIEIQPAIP